MKAPRRNEKIFERKEAARRRFDGMTLIEKIERMTELRRNLVAVFGERHPGYVAKDRQGYKLMPDCLICEQCLDELSRLVEAGRHRHVEKFTTIAAAQAL